MQQQYPKGSHIIFLAEKVEEAYSDGTTRFRASGKAYMPGKSMVNAKAMLPVDITAVEDAADFIDNGKFVGAVGWFQMKDGVEWCNLRSLTQETFETAWQDVELLPHEIKDIALRYPCNSCGNPIDIKNIGTTSISYYPQSTLVKRVICHHCVAKSVDTMDQLHREEFKARSHAA